MMSLAANKTSEMQHHSLCLVPLAENGDVRVLQRRQFFNVPLPLALELLGDLLLENKSLECIVALLLSAG